MGMSELDVFPPLFESPIGQVRLLIPDIARDENNEYIFTDPQIQAVLAMYGNNIKRAAGRAKDIIAADTTMLLKVIRTDDLNIDGVKVAAELRAQAQQLRAEADTDDLEDAADAGFRIVYPGRSYARAEASAWPLWG